MTEPSPRPRTLIPPLAWLFVVFAIVDAVWYVLNATFAANTPITDVIAHWVQVVPSVTSILLPAALLARHPDAGWRARTLLVGTIVLAVSQALVILSAPLESFFADADPIDPGSARRPRIVAVRGHDEHRHRDRVGLPSAWACRGRGGMRTVRNG